MGQLWCTATISYGAFGRPEGASRRYVHQITRFQGFQPPKINQEGPACDNVWTLCDSHIYLYISCHRCQQWWSESDRVRFWRLVSVMCPFSVQRDQLHLHTYIYMYLKKKKTTSMHFFRRRPMTMIWPDLAVTGLQLLYLHGPGSNNAMSEKQVQAVFKCLGVDICSPQRVAFAAPSWGTWNGLLTFIFWNGTTWKAPSTISWKLGSCNLYIWSHMISYDLIWPMAHSHVLDWTCLDSTSTAGEASGLHYPLVLDLESLSKCKLVMFFWERRSMKHLAHLRTGLALATSRGITV